MSGLRKIVSVNTSDRGGGAERVAWDLFQGFGRRGVDSWLVVGDKKSDDERVLPFFASPFVDYRKYLNAKLQADLQSAKTRDQAEGIEDFHFPYTKYLPTITGAQPDVILCHNLHGGFFDLRDLPALSRQLPIVLVLHDSWTMTGHCACPVNCAGWQTGCHNCPDLTAPPAIKVDNAHFNWSRKRDVFSQSRLFVAAPTHWLLERARQSILAPALREGRVIPCGVDLNVFHAGDRAAARRELGLPLDAHLLVFVANGTRSNPFKDYAMLERVVQRLSELMPDEAIVFLGLGEAGPERQVGRARLCSIAYQTPDRVAQYLRAADLYVHAAKTENFGLVTAEAQACGTPVVATAVGGLPEVVADGARGVLVPPGDAEQMAAAAFRLLANAEMRRRLGEQAAEYAQRFWDLEKIVSTYLDWFTEIQRAPQAA